jgi:hypothetical protein
MSALSHATGPKEGIYKMTLLDGTEIALPVRECGHVHVFQAQRGEKYANQTADDEIDVDRNVRVWIKKMNPGLMGGWEIVNDLSAAPNAAQGGIANKKIPISQIRTKDWAGLEAVLYDGSELDQKSLQERRAAVFGKV